MQLCKRAKHSQMFPGERQSPTRAAASLCSISSAALLTFSGMPEVESCAIASHFWAAVDCAASALPMPSRKACIHVELCAGNLQNDSCSEMVYFYSSGKVQIPSQSPAMRQGYQAPGVLRKLMAETCNLHYLAKRAEFSIRCVLSSPGCCQQLRPGHSHAAASPSASSLRTAPAQPKHNCFRDAPSCHASRRMLHSPLGIINHTHLSKAACHPHGIPLDIE